MGKTKSEMEIGSYEGGIMKKITILVNVFLLTSSLLLLSGCIEPVMSCAGIKTYPRCAKFCTHEAVAICEASVQSQHHVHSTH